mmetsp:Transcript_71056/g.148170  ORF Transcript_71056/g.148170 Transcript_71056/m.148170 type:complete len:207 (+) Transcript_71056:107-727(+)
MMFPIVTGMRLLMKNMAHVTPSAPCMMPVGMKNMFATECSKPMVTKAEMGNQIAIAFEPMSLAPVACQSPMQTSQLHRIPLNINGRKAPEVLARVMALAVATEGAARAPDANTSAASPTEPTKLPMKETIQFLRRSERPIFFSASAAVMNAAFPVRSSPPAHTTISSPKGRPKAPSTIFCSPRFPAATSPWQAPPTVRARQDPKAM